MRLALPHHTIETLLALTVLVVVPSDLMAARGPALPPGGGGGNARPPAKSSLITPGFFNQVPQLRNLIQLTLDGRNLKLDRDIWQDDAANAGDSEEETAVALELQIGGGFGGGGGRGGRGGAGFRNQATIVAAFDRQPVERAFLEITRGSGAPTGDSRAVGNDRLTSFDGTRLSGLLRVSGTSSFDSSIQIQVREEYEPRRIIDVVDERYGAFRLTATHPDGDMVLIVQTARGAVSVVRVIGGQSKSFSADSFEALYKSQRDFFESELIPTLNSLGMGVAFSTENPKVLGAVAARIAPLTGDVRRRGMSLISQLDHDDFGMREKAAQELSDHFDIYGDLIESRRQDRELSAEASSRLNDIADRHPGDTRVIRLVNSLDLANDARYLASALPKLSRDDRAMFIEQLRKITGQNLGDNPEAWKNWVESRGTRAR